MLAIDQFGIRSGCACIPFADKARAVGSMAGHDGRGELMDHAFFHSLDLTDFYMIQRTDYGQ